MAARNTGITIRDFTLVGNSTTPGVYQGGKEGAHGVLDRGLERHRRLRRHGQRRLGRLLLRRGLGRHRQVPRLDLPVDRPQRGHDHLGPERHDPARRVPQERLRASLDIEPNLSSEGATNVKFLDNTAGTWSDSFFSAFGARRLGHRRRDRQRQHHHRQVVAGRTSTLARRQNIVFTNNTLDRRRSRARSSSSLTSTG